MALSTPTTSAISDNVIAQLELALSQTIPVLPKSFSRVLAKALAGVVVLLYKYAGFMLLQMFVEHATFESTAVNGVTIRPLVEWGRLIGIGDPTPATQAELTITVTVSSMTGQLPANSLLIRGDTGVVYATQSAVDLDAGTVTARIKAVSDEDDNGGAGTIGNLDVSDTLEFANPIPSVERSVTVATVEVTAATAETETAYRERVVDRYQKKPQGGAYADYETWGKSVAGVIKIYPYTGALPGEVDVYAEATVASSGSADGIPTSAQLTAVAEAIESTDDGLAANRPVGAAVNVSAIARTAIDIEVTGLSDSSAESGIEAALDEYLRDREPYIVGLSMLPRRDRITEAALGGVVTDAAEAAGATFSTLAMSISATDYTAYTLGQGEKAKAGSVTFA